MYIKYLPWNNPRNPPATCPTKSIFNGTKVNCTPQGLITLCEQIKKSGNKTLLVDGSIKCVATLGYVVGQDRDNHCNNTNQGTVIYDPGIKKVKTAFPGLSGQ